MKRSIIAHCSESIAQRSCKFLVLNVIATYIIGLWYVPLSFASWQGNFFCKPVKCYSLLDQVTSRNLSTSSVECECHVNFMVGPVIRTPLLDRMSIQLQFTFGNTGLNVLQISIDLFPFLFFLCVYFSYRAILYLKYWPILIFWHFACLSRFDIIYLWYTSWSSLVYRLIEEWSIVEKMNVCERAVLGSYSFE
jgi:hypothetical protein